MSKITNITLENIKGFGTTNNSFDIEIFSGKYNILVAPNGFGKSSITTAFNSLSNRRLELEKGNYHKEDDSLPISLSIKENGQVYVANSNKNEISENFKVFCVRNRLYAKAVSKNLGRYTNTVGHLAIDGITIVTSIPFKQEMPYSISKIKQSFGKNSKVLSNIRNMIFQNNIFLSRLEDLYRSLDKFNTVGRRRLIRDIIESINQFSGTAEHIISHIQESIFEAINQDQYYLEISTYIKKHNVGLSETNTFLIFYQLESVYRENKSLFKKSVKRANYELFKNEFDTSISLLGSTWKNIRTQEQKEKLVINFPKADNISYGQRDSLTLLTELLTIKSSIRLGDKCIIIIDEVFDYLDDVNLTTTQYYLSEIVNEMGKICTIYPIIMTHLSPEYFQNFVFNPKKMKVIYLKNTQSKINSNMKKLLLLRGSKDICDELKNEIAHYLLHFSVGEIDKENDFETLGLPKNWGKGTYFLEFVVNQINEYLSGTNKFDPYAVCTAVRLRIEKLVYDKIPNTTSKEHFVNVFMTKNKLDYAEPLLNESISDIYYMLGIIYNDALHLNTHSSEKPVVNRLNSLAITDMIKKIFSYSPTDIVTLAHIH